MDDKRAEPRLRSLKGARIVFNNGFSTMDCMARNLSPGGAKLVLPSTAGIPDSFGLNFEDGKRHTCTVRWRTPTELGVSFED
ncbi:PilZ domain-containing protein [Ciceribacter ferrooxidans]|uniref:PilZ domain-containing protein n=1 Tax=Ciceribacter ferrooxidans TaxID=2509717 RepID=A0A4Q2TFM6_9HYPH|nr:PilZ domain-containing protein [Ciceribacter ferrooxidans]RYC17500.1 PilZ domain-containing protein [Ciceribacter ferrooxidans]